MQRIFLTNDKSLSKRNTVTLYEGEKNVDCLELYIPHAYNQTDLRDCSIRLCYITPDDNEHSFEVNDYLVDAEYKDEYSVYRIDIDTQFTSVVGEIDMYLSITNQIEDREIIMKTGCARVCVRHHRSGNDGITDEVVDIIDQVVIKANNAIKTSEDALEIAQSVRDDADNGLFDGEDGFSPLVSVGETEIGHTVTITDKDGEKSFDIPNGIDGENGEDGYSPTVSVNETEVSWEITIADVDGAKTFEIAKGRNGSDANVTKENIESALGYVPADSDELVNKQDVITDLEQIRENASNVGDWAREENKPEYTAEEVGALSEDTFIPTKTSELINDSGYLTEHQDISGKVDKIIGKGLSTNDYDNVSKAKVDAIPQNPKYTDTVYDDTDIRDEIAEAKQTANSRVTHAELEDAISTLELCKVVDELPETGESNKLYLVTREESADNNVFDEYLYVGEKWEFVGSMSSEIDLSDYVKNTDIATDSKLGVVRAWEERGVAVGSDGRLRISAAGVAAVRNGSDTYQPIVPARQNQSTFYGLAKAAGVDEKDSTLPVGEYSVEAKAAIQKMIGAVGVPDGIADGQLLRAVVDTDGNAVFESYEIPVASNNEYGTVMLGVGTGLRIIDGRLYTFPAATTSITRRFEFYVITPRNMDFAVKAAMTDGIGEAWTDAEKKAALARLGCTVGEDGIVRFG